MKNPRKDHQHHSSLDSCAGILPTSAVTLSVQISGWKWQIMPSYYNENSFGLITPPEMVLETSGPVEHTLRTTDLALLSNVHQVLLCDLNILNYLVLTVTLFRRQYYSPTLPRRTLRSRGYLSQVAQVQCGRSIIWLPSRGIWTLLLRWAG